MSGVLQKIAVDKIINYFENPRHAIGSDEKDTLKKLYDAVGTQYMLNLAEDIKTNGLLGNQQVVVVYSEPTEKYVVYEGNRRIAAIKLLMNPSDFDFLDNATIEKAKKLAQEMVEIQEILCYVTDEEEAFFIMERTHSGEDKGRGVKSWSPREREEFRVRRNHKKTMAYLVDFYVRKYYDNLDITKILPFTTLERVFNCKGVKETIGLDVADEATFTCERMKVVIDASIWIANHAEEIDVAPTRLYNRIKEIEEEVVPWLRSYLAGEIISATCELEDSSKEEFDVSEQAEGNVKCQSTGSTEDKINDKLEDEVLEDNASSSVVTANTPFDQRLGGGNVRNLPYFFQGLDYSKLDPNDADSHGISAVCRELQIFSEKRLVEKLPLAAAFLVRAVIEQSIKYYSKKHYIQGQNKFIWENIQNITSLSKIIEAYNKQLPNYITNSEMRQYFETLFQDYQTNIDPLNWVVHRPSEFQLDSRTLIELPRKGLLALINFFIS